MGCNAFERFTTEQLNHKPKYNSDYNNMSEDELERMTVDKEESMLVDPTGEERWQEDLRKRQGEHFKNCDDPNCIRLCNNWRGHSELAKYV